MAFDRKFPWTNFQELNLNWFIRKWEDFKTDWATAKAELESTESTLTQAVDDKITEIDGALADEVATVEDLVDTVQEALGEIEEAIETITDKLDKSTSTSSGFYYHTGDGSEILAPSPLSVAFGGTGGSIASQARTNLGAEASENKTDDLSTNYASTTYFPTCNAVAEYVSGRITTLQTLLNNAISTGDTYTLGQAKSYADTQDGLTLASAKSYTNSKDSAMKTYVDTQDTSTLNSAKSYTDGKDSAMKTYVDTQDALKVDKTTTVNGKALSANVTLTAEDIGYTASGEHTENSVGEAISEVNNFYTELKSAAMLNFNDLRTTNRVFNSESETVSGSGAYVVKEIPFNATSGEYYGTIQSSSGGTSGNFLAYLSAYDSENTRLAQSAFSSTYPASVYLNAPANTVKLKLRLFATLETSESDKNVTFNGISILKGSESVQISLKNNVSIESVTELQDTIFGTTQTNVKTFSGTGETNLDINVSVSKNTEVTLTLTNENVTGDAQIYDYDGSNYVSIKYLTLENTNSVSFVTARDITRIRIHYIISAVSTNPKSTVVTGISSNYAKIDRNIIHVGSDYDYTDIQTAIDACQDSETKPCIIFIHNGVYTPFKMLANANRVRYISLIGESRDCVIIRGDAGTYSKPTANVCTNGVIKNITFIQETTQDSYEGEGTQPYCYALHDDSYRANTEYNNCTFISNAGPSVGMGLKKDATKRFTNCTFINNGDGTYGSITIGSMFVHSEDADNSTNQKLFISNCLAINKNGANGLYLSEITGHTGTSIYTRINNTGSFGDGSASAYCTLQLEYSFNNNVNALNVI